MLNDLYNWFLNTFVRINPIVKTIIFMVILLVILWTLQLGLKKSKAGGGTKLKEWGIPYFVCSFLAMTLAILIIIL